MLMWLSHFPISIPSSIWYVSSPFCKTCSRFKTKSLWADTMTGIELQNKETNWTKMKREQCMYIINFRNILLSELSIIKDSNLSRVSRHRECYTITFEQKAFVKFGTFLHVLRIKTYVTYFSYCRVITLRSLACQKCDTFPPKHLISHEMSDKKAR